jgi:hypothetical protein
MKMEVDLRIYVFDNFTHFKRFKEKRKQTAHLKPRPTNKERTTHQPTTNDAIVIRSPTGKNRSCDVQGM